MKFSCEKSALLQTINTTSRAAAVKNAIPALEGLLIEAGENVTVTGYDLKTGIISTFEADVSERGAIVMNARLFGDIIRKLPDDIVTITVDENNSANIKCGMSDFNILGISAADYPELPSVPDATAVYLQQKVLKSMIAETNFAVSDNEARPIHTGELFEIEDDIITIVAVDGYRLALRREAVSSADLDKISFVVPGAALSEVEKILDDSEDMVKIVPGLKHVMFTIGKTVLVSRRLEGEFLNYRNSIPKVGKYTIDADRRAVIDAVERVSLIISDKLKSPVRCIFSDGVLKVSTTTTLGRAYDECPITGDGEELEIGFNNRYILDALRAIQAPSIRMQLSTGISPCVIVPADGSKNFIYMVLPVRLRANEG